MFGGENKPIPDFQQADFDSIFYYRYQILRFNVVIGRQQLDGHIVPLDAEQIATGQRFLQISPYRIPQV